MKKSGKMVVVQNPKEIIQFVKKNGKDGRKMKVGVLYATLDKKGKNVLIGTSKYNLKMEKRAFDPINGILIAKGRAMAGNFNYPLSLKKALKIFEKRCTRYFKKAKVNSLTNHPFNLQLEQLLQPA